MPVDVEFGARVVDVEVAHGQLTDPVERPERGVFDALHAEPFGRVREVGPRRVEDRVVVAAAQSQRDFASDGGTYPTQEWLAQHQALRVEPAALVQQPAEAPAHGPVV